MKVEDFYWKGYEDAKEEMTKKLQCCANCKHNDFGRRCSKGQTGECKDYSRWEIHNHDGVEM